MIALLTETCHYRPHPSRRNGHVYRVACGLFKDPACITRSKEKVDCRNCRRSVAFQGIETVKERQRKKREDRKMAAAISRLRQHQPRR